MRHVWTLFVVGALALQHSMAVPTMLLNPRPQQNVMGQSAAFMQPQGMQAPAMNFPSMGMSNGIVQSQPMGQSLLQANSMLQQPMTQSNAMFQSQAAVSGKSQDGFMLSSSGSTKMGPQRATTCRYQIKFTLKPGANAILNELYIQSELKRILNVLSLDSFQFQNWKQQPDGMTMDAPKDVITRIPTYRDKKNQARFNGIRLDNRSPFEATVANQVCVTVYL
jgi:hypothetical protein